jgi:glycerol-3-phosphate dehydrogenase (NAD(P)+)
MNIAVIGIGAWGTALARLLDQPQHQITLWSHDPRLVESIQNTGRNDDYLPGIDLPPALRFTSDICQATQNAHLIIAAVASQYFRATMAALHQYNGIVVSVTKGIEHESGLPMSGVLRQTMPRASIAALSGPTLAMEVARGVPTAIVAASSDPTTATTVQQVFHRAEFRVYTSSDILGVELGGALKNVIAVAAGVCDGLGFGDNSKAALVTRGLAEMRRLGVACGAQPETFSGLSGLGDLTVTCFSRLSRNRGFGERLGRGETADQIVTSMKSVAEGVPTSRSAQQLARRHQVAAPVIDEVFALVHQKKNVRDAVRDVLSRDSKPED